MRYISKILFLTTLIFIGLNSFATAPPTPTVVSFSVIPESSPTIIEAKWIPSSDLSVDGYYIFYKVKDIWGRFDTIYGRTVYTKKFLYKVDEDNIGPYIKPAEYAMGAFDTANFVSIRGVSHTTMFLETIDFEKCDTSTTLNWSAYLGWENNVNKYNIYRRSDTTTYILLDTVPGYTLFYTDTANLQMGITYYYYIEAVSQNGYAATSNSQSIYTQSFMPPNYIIADYATVDSSKVKLLFTVDPHALEVKKYYIKRKDYRSNGQYLVIDSVDNTAQVQIFYTDAVARTDDYSYSYKIASVSSCGVETAESNFATTVHLKASNINTESGLLEWNEYEYWDKGVFIYNVYLVYNDETTYIGTTDFYEFNFTHDIKNVVEYNHKHQIPLDRKVCYLVEAVENQDYMSISYSSWSNVACMYKDPIIYVPTAFNPVSDIETNRTFRPIVSFVDLETYEFEIFDRFGERIFRTNNVLEGWTGKVKHGKFVEQEVYTYQIKFRDGKNKMKRKTGTFSVIYK